MGLFNNLRGMFRNNATSSGMSVEQLRQAIAAGGGTDAGVDVSSDSAMRCATVFACVRVLAETAAQLPLPVYKRSGNGDERAVDRSHPLHAILNQKPNRWQTAFEFREMMTAYVVLRGNAYAYVNRDVLTGAPRELIPLKPGTVRPVQLDDYSVEYQYSPARGGSQTLKQRDILHIRGISSDGVEGMTPIKAFRNAVGLAMAAERHQSKSFGNGVKIPGVLRAKKTLTPDAIRNLRESFGEMHSGENAFRVPVLEEDMDYTQIGMNSDDAQTIETRQFQRGEIASIFRVPLHMINGDVEATKGWSTLEQQGSEFVTYSMVPWFERWEQALARDLMTPEEQETHFVEHKVASLLRGDTQSRYASYNMAIMSGWMSRNEARALENLPPRDGLDVFLTPVNMATAAQEEQKRQQAQQDKKR